MTETKVVAKLKVGLLRRTWRQARRALRDVAGLWPVSARRVELCWKGAARPEPVREIDLCTVEVQALFQRSPDNEQAEELAGLASGVASRFGRVSSCEWTTEASGVVVGKAREMPKGTLMAMLTLLPQGGKLDWAALDNGLHEAMAARHRRFKVLLNDPSRMVPRGPSAVGWTLGRA